MTVWDCILLNDELDLLEARLQIMGPVIDKLVVVEAAMTFTGKPKPLHLREAWDRFAPWHDKLVPVEAKLSEKVDDVWDREHEQEAATLDGLVDLKPEDLLLIGDLDELVHPHVVKHLAANLDEPLRLVQRHAIYRANWVVPEPWEEGTFACRGSDLDNPMLRWHLGEGHLPDLRAINYTEPLLLDAGWHVSYLGDANAVRAKFEAFTHQEFNNARDNDPAHLARLIENRVHFVGRIALEVLPPEQLDSTLRHLLELRPEWFDFASPPRWRQHAYTSWVWLRRSPRVPERLVTTLDRQGPAYSALVPVLLALDAMRRRKRARKVPDPEWKVARRIPALPFPPA
ncbi:MAG TPA: hypothetical protein VHE83_02905 [Mycobacteriales bacterium]|nr:hypothetical protein [Mycobacteriales bacterium]